MGIVHYDNTLYMKGLNKDGQFGIGDKVSRIKIFEQITEIEPTRVESINCRIVNTCAIDKIYLLIL